MILQKINVKRLRAIKGEKVVTFSPGLNIIKGDDNETGKSSLRIAITKALFQDSSTTRKEIEELTSWGAEEPWEVSLEFEAGGAKYRITRNFKDKASELVSLDGAGFSVKNKSAIAEKIAELTGCPSEVFFESTACIDQDDLIRIIPEDISGSDKQEAKGSITQRLQARLSGTKEIDTVSIIDWLYRQTHHKEAGGPHFHLQQVSERIVSLRSQEEEQSGKMENIMAKRSDLARVKAELPIVRDEYKNKKDLLDKNATILDLQKTIEREKAQYDSFLRARELKSRIDSLDEELKPFAFFYNTDDAVKELDSTKRRVDALSKQLLDLKNELDYQEKQKPSKWVMAAGATLIAAGLAGLIVSMYSLGLVIGGILLLAYWAVVYNEWHKQNSTASHKIAETEKMLQEGMAEEERLLNRFQSRDYDEFQTKLTSFRALVDSQRMAQNKMDAYLGGKDWQTFNSDNTDLSIQISGRMKELQDLQGFKLPPLELQKLANEVEALRARKEELERDEGALDTFLQLTESDNNQLVEVEEELKDLDAKRAFWEYKKSVYELTRKMLEQAHKQTMSRASDLLETEISRYMAIITDNRYNRVKIDENDLSVSTFSPEKNDWVDVTKLSRATQDQFYICARLALVGLITEGKHPPILLDDPFVNFHAKRLRKMMSLLQEIAAEYQIILFTCSDAYDYLGNIISINNIAPVSVPSTDENGRT